MWLTLQLDGLFPIIAQELSQSPHFLLMFQRKEEKVGLLLFCLMFLVINNIYVMAIYPKKKNCPNEAHKKKRKKCQHFKGNYYALSLFCVCPNLSPYQLELRSICTMYENWLADNCRLCHVCGDKQIIIFFTLFFFFLSRGMVLNGRLGSNPTLKHEHHKRVTIPLDHHLPYK